MSFIETISICRVDSLDESREKSKEGYDLCISPNKSAVHRDKLFVVYCRNKELAENLVKLAKPWDASIAYDLDGGSGKCVRLRISVDDMLKQFEPEDLRS